MNKYKESVLDNGLRIITHEDKSVPIVDVQLVFKAGSRYEEGHQKGYAHILEHMLLKGTVKRPGPVILAQEIDSKGGYKNAYTSRESLVMILQAADNYAEELFELLSDMFFNSLIDSEILENEKKVIIEELKRADDNTESFFGRFTFEKLFSGHPLSTNILGDVESIMSADSGKLRAYKEKFLIPGRAALVISGNISHDRVVVLAKKYFEAWSEKSNIVEPVALSSINRGPYFYAKDTKQTLIAYNFLTVSADKIKELAALDILQNFLNFGGSSVLTEELRHKRGLVYSVGLINNTFNDAGLFRIQTSTSKPEETIEAIKDIFHNLKSLFTENLLSGIKLRLIGAFKLRIANPYTQTGLLSAKFIAYSKLVTPEEYINEINSVSYDDVIHAINTYLVPEKAVITAIGPEDFTK